MSSVPDILTQIECGDPLAAAQLLPLVYQELRKLAAGHMANEPSNQTLNATGLVHAAYLRLVGPTGDKKFANRGHFFAAAAEAMRRILVENARRKRRLKHGGGRQREEMRDSAAQEVDERMLALDEALARLAIDDPVAAKVVELRHFAGLGHDGVAATLGITVYQARQKWTYSRAWLLNEMRAEVDGQ